MYEQVQGQRGGEHTPDTDRPPCKYPAKDTLRAGCSGEGAGKELCRIASYRMCTLLAPSVKLWALAPSCCRFGTL